jgi:thiosulfate reductase cytochrome b subunit
MVHLAAMTIIFATLLVYIFLTTKHYELDTNLINKENSSRQMIITNIYKMVQPNAFWT